MHIIITGSESFIGRELIAQCNARGIAVSGFDAVRAGGTTYEFHHADIRSPEISEHIPRGADALIHLAALSRDSDCTNRAYECFDINVMGTLNLMRAAEERGVKQFIFASSEWVYDTCTEHEVKTEDSFVNIGNHTSEYALSKLVGEANLRQKSKHGFCPVTVLRFGIVYGPRPANWAAIEALFYAVQSKDEVEIGSKKTGRHFIHVSDIALAIIAAIGQKNPFEIYNVTSDTLITLEAIIDASSNIFGKAVRVIESNPAHPSVRRVSNQKMKKELGWSPKFDLTSGLSTLDKNVNPINT